MKVDNTIRSLIMSSAWSRYRQGGYAEFGLALKASWKRERKARAYAKSLLARAKANGGKIQFNDLIRSPIRRASLGATNAADKDFRAAYTTAMFGR